MADSYQGTDNFTAPSEASNALEFDTTQSMEEEEDNDVTQSMEEEEEEEDNDVTQMGKEIVEYKSIPSKSGRRIRRRLSSEVWEVFVKLPRSSDGRERNKCKLCGKVYLCESILATGNMKRHLKMCPKMKTHDVDQMFESGSEGGSSSDSDRKDPQVFQELVTAAIIMHDLPLRFFEWSQVRKMIEFMSDDVNLVSKKTTEMDVLKVHRREKEVVKTTIEEAYGRVCLTAEWWTAMNTDNYMCVTAHFLDKNWVLQKRMLDFCWMPTPHDVVSLTNKFNTLLWEWGIDKKLCSLTLDNALSDKSFVNNLKRLLNLRKPLVCNGDFLHIHCCAHILDLIVQDGLKDINEVVHKIRESIICVKVSTELRQKFLECIKQVSLDCKKGLRQDIPTIWNSTYLMLENALYYRRAWCLLELFDINFKLCPSASEWDKVEKSIKFFGIFYEIACIFSRTKCLTSNMYFPKMIVALITLKQNLESEDVFLKKMTNQMYTKFYKYWADSCTILAIAVILDPRYKMKFVEFAFEKVYDDGSVQLELVQNTLYSLFSEYMTNSTGTSTSKASFASGVTSTSTHGTSFDLMDTVMKEFDASLVSDDCIQKTQLELYLDEPRLDRSMDLDILSFWKVNEFRYPVLATMARDVLTIPISTVTSKSAFYIDGRNLYEYHSSLKPNVMNAMFCTRNWLYGEEETRTLKWDEIAKDVQGF